MKVVLSTPGKFHTFDLARELHSNGILHAIFTGYPRFKLKTEQIPQQLIHSFPWVHAPYMRISNNGLMPEWIIKQWEYLDKVSLDYFVGHNMPACDIFVGLSGSALKSGRKAKTLGAKYVCDRGSSHIRTQDQLLAEEYALWGEHYLGIDPRVIAREEAEYAEADCITVPSTFNVNSFIDQGVPEHKIKRISYGVNLNKFHPTTTPSQETFDVLFVGGMQLRKGVQYLLQAYKALHHPQKTLTLAGSISQSFINLMRTKGHWDESITVLGHVDQAKLKDVMSRSHVMVLPSIEEGLAMVQAQAMACGCPVIGTQHTGAEDLFSNGKEGFIVPIRNPYAITEKLQLLADSPDLQKAMREASLKKVQAIGGWAEYGRQAVVTYQGLLS
ncbi:MAG TPA: glycosyltransferase family 4 protein [Methylophilaceae bacterium]|jgi:glycosyltransferase involved in cell wall biosynthesis